MGAQHSKQPYYPRWGFQEAFGLSPHCSAAAAPQSSESGSSNDVSENTRKSFESITSGLEEQGLSDTDVQSYAELEQQKSLQLHAIDGLQAQVTVPFTKLDDDDSTGMPMSSLFAMQHLMMLGGSGAAAMVQSSATYQESEQKNFAMTVVSHGPGPCMVIPSLTYPVGDGKFNLQSIMSNGQGSPQMESLSSQLTTKGPDFAVDLGITRGERTGDAWNLNYMQSVIGSLCLGGFGKLYTKPSTLFDPSSFTWGLNGSWQSEDQNTTVLGQYDHEKQEASVLYHHIVEDKLKLGCKANFPLGDSPSTVASAEIPIRIEKQMGSIPYTTLSAEVECKGSIVDPDVTMRTNIDHLLLQGQGGVTVSASFDHKNKDYKMGVGYRVQA